MDRLDDLEAQSILILRAAFGRLRKPWSLGKDSNIVTWLAPQGVLRPAAVPRNARHTDKKFRKTCIQWNIAAGSEFKSQSAARSGACL
jgi:hypothetical protein